MPALVSPKWHVWFSARSKVFWLLTGLSILVAAGWLDCVTGAEINVTIFYLVPIGMVTWYAGKWYGLALSIIGAGVWYAADLLGGHRFSHPHIAAWDTLVSLGFFLLANGMI